MYRQRRVARLITEYSPTVVAHTYGGNRFNVMLADPLAEGWYDHDWERLREIDELVRRGGLGPGAIVFDVGAHQGVVALMLAAEVGPRGKVVAVEAQPHNASIARRNVGLNGASNIEVVHAAIADRSGTVRFADGLNGRVDAGTRLGNVEVEAVTVDQLAQLHGAPDVVFLDVEGYEGKALAGAAATLYSRNTSFFVEVHGDELIDCTAVDITSRFSGYDVLVAGSGRNGQADAFAPLDRTPPAGRFFLLATPEAR
jgi:FkbM family methyltransferase